MLHQIDRRAERTHAGATPGDDRIEFVFVDSVAGFEALEPAWRALAARSAKPHQVFQCHSWLAAWCRHYADRSGRRGDSLAVVAAYRGEDLVLALPLILRRRFGVRMLKWMGIPVSQYGDALVVDHPAARSLLDAALEFGVRRTRADLILLRKVREDAAVAPVLEALGARVLIETAAPFADLSSCPDGESHLRRLSGNARKQRRRRRRRLEDKGPVAFRWLNASEAAGEQARLAVRDKQAVLSEAGVFNALDAHFEAFFADYCSREPGDVQPVVATLSCGGETIAREVGLVHKGHYVAHVGSFDPAFSAFAPGTLQIDDTLKACRDRAVHTYDMLAPSDPYKLSFAERSVAVRDWLLPRTVRGAVYCRVAESLVPRFKALRDYLDRSAKRTRNKPRGNSEATVSGEPGAAPGA